jgi:predicted RNA polymerase sigma factor
VPAADELSQRLAGVLAVIYLLFNEGYLCSAGEVPQRRDLTDDAEWLAALLARLMPAEPEVLGLLALIRLHRAIVLGRVLGPQAALDETDALAADLDRYHLYHATRAELLRELARPAQARQADERALGLTGNPAERALLEQRLA